MYTSNCNLIDETEIMQQNLQKLIKNQNYFSCFIESAPPQQQPTNPFQKKLFDKNLRRSTMSLGHYGTTSHNQSSNLEEESHRMSSSRRNSFGLSHNIIQGIPSQSKPVAQTRIESAHKVSLAQSRHSDPVKQQITQIINIFRLELDYLQEKLHNRIEQINLRYEGRQCEQKCVETGFMVESLQKIIGFMVQNCVNLQDSVIYGDKFYDEQPNPTSENGQIMRRQIYQIQQNQNEYQQNISFNCGNDNYKPTQRLSSNNINGAQTCQRKRKIVGLVEKQNRLAEKQNRLTGKQNNLNTNNTNNNQNLPQTYFVDNKLHSINQSFHKDKIKQQNSNKPPNDYSSSKVSNRAPSKSRNPKNQNHSEFQYHSAKQAGQYQNVSMPEHSHQGKSIYQTVLEEREMRMRMKKRMV